MMGPRQVEQANQNGKRKSVVIVRERGGNSVPAVFRSESVAAGFIKSHIAEGTVVHADAAPGWDSLHAAFEMKRIDHSKAYSLDGACTNMAGSTSLASAEPRLGTITISPGSTFFATLRRRAGARTSAASATATSSAA